MGLRAGDLRQRITFQQKVDVANGRGGFTREWVNLTSAWAAVISQNGREAVINTALQGISTYRITVRWRAGITNKNRILYGAEELNIRSVVDPDGRRERLDILADTGSPEGG
jgi:SPP1 family predicted phage head-tail adaptor